jgi:hypothetical protein
VFSCRRRPIDRPCGPRDDLRHLIRELERRSVEVACVVGRTKRGERAPYVLGITLRHVSKHLGLGNIASLGGKVAPSPACALVCIRIQINFEIGLGENDGANVAPLDDCAAAGCRDPVHDLPLLLDHSFSNAAFLGNDAGKPTYLRRSNRVRYVFRLKEHFRSFVGVRQSYIDIVDYVEGRSVWTSCLCSVNSERNSPVHGSCVHVQKSQSPRYRLSGGAFTGSSRTVNCYNHK